MNPLLSFVGITILLTIEGILFINTSRLRGTAADRVLQLSLSLPIGAFLNLLIFLVLTAHSIALNATNILFGHCIILLFLICVQPLLKRDLSNVEQINCTNYEQTSYSGFVKFLSVLGSLVILSTLIYGAVHSFMLPTYHYDSTTNWNMRSKISFYEQQIVFSGDEIRKPNYPFLYHALQVTANQLQSDWNESSANGIHFLLSLSSFAALFLIIRKLKGLPIAIITLSVVLGMPLMTLHMGQSYADITLVQFALLSLGCFLMFLTSDQTQWLILSALFVSACVWTKADGFFFCLVPWILMLGADGFRNSHHKSAIRLSVVVALVLSLLWPVTAWLNNVSLTPHGAGDFMPSWNTNAVNAFTDSLFVQGSFGILWFALLPALCLIFYRIRNNDPRLDRRFVQPLVWGLLALGGYVIVYLFTSNVEYLLNHQSFDRQMMLPASLLSMCVILSLAQTTHSHKAVNMVE